MTFSPVSTSSWAWRLTTGCLRVVIAVQCYGLASGAWRYGTAIHSLLFNEKEVGGWDWTEQQAKLVDHNAANLHVICALIVLFTPAAATLWRRLQIGRSQPNAILFWQVPALVWIAIWQAAFAIASWQQGGNFVAELPFHLADTTGENSNMAVNLYRLLFVLASQAVRIIAPIGLLILAPFPVGASIHGARVVGAIWLLRLAAAFTFLTHGYDALNHHPVFMNYVIHSGRFVLGWKISQPTAEFILSVIGGIDILMGPLILVRRWKWVAGYMSMWGIITAFSRVTSAGWSAFDETLIRAANGGVPLAILIYWLCTRSQHEQDDSETPASHKNSQLNGDRDHLAGRLHL